MRVRVGDRPRDPFKIQYTMASTASVTTTRKINVSPHLALAYIHDTERLVRLNPLVTAVEKTAKENTWRVTDRIKLLGFIPYNTHYEIFASLLPDGSDITVTAALGIRSFSKWRVITEEGQGAECTVTEEASISAPKFLLPFVRGTLKESHEQMQERMEKELLEDASRA